MLKSRQLTCTSTWKGYVYTNVGRDEGIEPTTFGLDLRRSTDCATRSEGSRPWELKMLKSRQLTCTSTWKGYVYVCSIPTLVRVFLCPCVGPVPSVGLTLTWFIWDRNIALHVTLHSLQLILFKI